MASESLQYDAALGGPVRIPDEIDSLVFNEARVAELKTLLRSVASTDNQTKLMHQALPLHMRRRAMSYNPKRLPRKFRGIHLAQYSKSGIPERKKRPSRKYRRKANNLLREYERRKRSNVWLETHIWHAKRFHMVAKWGYKIPYTPTNKGYRACYRATAKHCLLQDISYFGCIEIQGTEEILKQNLKRICSEKIGLTLVAKAFLNGKRSGHVWIFKTDRYPFQCIGKVRFLWKSEPSSHGSKTLWLFAHPIFYSELVEELISIFNLKNNQTHNDLIEVDCTRDVKQIISNLSTIRTPKFVNNSTGISVTLLKDTLNYFRLTGPLSHAILSKALKPYSRLNNANLQNWFTNWTEIADVQKILSEQKSFWENTKTLTSPGELSSGLVVGLLVEDPRLNRPQKRTKALPTIAEAVSFYLDAYKHLAHSPIWSESIRNKITKDMLSTHELNLLRAKECLVPGERCSFEENIQPIPILLMQNSGSQNSEFKQLGYGAGWDVIVPSGYGLALWHTLILWGAKPAGLKEFDMQDLESGINITRTPDTLLGQSEATLEYEKCWNKYFAKPNNRRVNYKKLSIASPFRCPWDQLVSEWNIEADSKFYVLRDQEIMSKINLALNRMFNLKSIQVPSCALIPVYLTMKSRGSPGDNALICLPQRLDFRANKQHKQRNDSSPIYTEALRKDSQQKERLELRRQHLQLLKKLRNRRIRKKKLLQRMNPGTLIKIAKPQNAEIIKDQLIKMRELWLPAKPETIRNQCSRECFGYITQSNFSLSEAKVVALGYVTAKGLEKLFKICLKGTIKVLVRGTKSRCYRFATIKVRTD